MQCHYCDRGADVTVDKDGVKVGLCEDHFQNRLDDLSNDEALQRLRDQLEIDRA